MSKTLTQLLAEVDKAGVFYCPPEVVADLESAAEANALRIHHANIGAAKDKADILAALAEGLKFSPHFGQNFDALADALGDLPLEGKQGHVVMLAGVENARNAAENDLMTVLEIFTGAAEEWREKSPPLPFWCLVDGPAAPDE